jgi:uncharacterized protein (TIGR03118 family)
MLVAGGSAIAADSHRAMAGGTNSYLETDLVSDVPGAAANLDPNLVNAWGLVAGPSTPWWVADNGTSLSTLYDGNGNPLSLVVKVPSAPTGIVFNGGSSFVISHGGASGPAVFIFSTESGVLRGWNPSVPPPATSTMTVKTVDRSHLGAVYKGLAMASTAAGTFLYATDFHNGRVDMFDSNFNLVSNPGAFVDPALPPHYAPFGIQNLGGVLFVTYAQQNKQRHDDVHGPGHGFVDMYDSRGNLLGRVASKGPLNSPWGLAVAPAGFGQFGGDLLIGNFGDGRINAFAPQAGGTYQFAGTLARPNGADIVIDGLWALQFGNDGPAGSSNALYFTAGPAEESHGLFGNITVA